VWIKVKTARWPSWGLVYYSCSFSTGSEAASRRHNDQGKMIKGSCLCGAFRFEIDGRVSDLHRCHCSICRKATGAGAIAILATAVGSLNWVCGEDAIRTFERPSGWSTCFCPTCGTPAPRLHQNGKIWMIPAGCLDDDPGTQVAEHIFVGSIASWDAVSPGAAEHDEWASEGEG
jgi:hypothetical protein